MSVQAIYLKNALVPQARVIRDVEPATVAELAPTDWRMPFVAFVDGQVCLRKDWGGTLQHGQSVAFVDVRAIPQGGNNNGGSDPVRIVAMVAIMYFTMGAGSGWLVGAGSLTGATGFAATAVQAGAFYAGSMLLNAVLPPPKPPTPMQTASMAAASPTYSLTAQGNTGRLEAAIPEHFGRMLAYPDFAAMPYSEYSGNEQYLYQLLCVGRGYYDIEAVRIEKTPVSSFDDITYEVVQPGGTLSLFPSAVVTSGEVSGQTLACRAGTYSQSGTTITVSLTSHGLSTGKTVRLDFTTGTATSLYGTVTSAPTPDSFTVTAGATATTSGNVTVAPVVGSFVANASGTTVNYIGVDFVLPRGLYQFTGTGALQQMSLTVIVEARQIDDAGNPLGGFLQIGSHTYTAATTTPQRFSHRYAMAGGRYDVRVRRLDIEQTDTSYGHNIVWAGMRAYLPETRSFGDVTLIAMRMKASNNLSVQASRKINVIATRKLPMWTGTGWTANTATRSIAWAFTYVCKQIGLTDAQIDLAGLQALDSTWATRGDYFDARFDSFLSFWEAVTKVLQAGRAKPFMQGGVMRIVRDQAQSVPVALFSMRNIKKNSFSVDYLMPTPDTADAVNVAYFDSGSWASARVQAKLTGSTAAKPAKIDLFGVTGRDQAFREGMYYAACNRYRRKTIRFTTEMEGFIPSFGDLIAIQHDMPAWGQGGEVIDWNPSTLDLTLSEPPVWGTGNHYIALRKRDGSVDGPYLCTAGAAPTIVHLLATPAITPYTGTAEERTHYTFGWSETWRQPARVLSVRPRSQYEVEIEAINEDVNVHTAESSAPTPTQSSSQLANYTNYPQVLGLIARSMPGAPEKMLLTWQSSPWADYYIVEQSSDNVSWTRCGETRTSNFTATAIYGSATMIRVAAVGISRGPWVTVSYGAAADYMWSAVDTTLMWNADPNTNMWKY